MEAKELFGTKGIESALKQIWDRAKTISEIITNLRDDNRTLQTRAMDLEKELRKLRMELETRELELKNVKDRYTVAQASLEDTLSPDEKEALRLRIKELLAKLNSHFAQ
jgi:chromosome segregation ATPase